MPLPQRSMAACQALRVPRVAFQATVAWSLAVGLSLAGCGVGESRENRRSLMQRCGDGRTLTVIDPAGDGLNASDASAENRRAVAANPEAFDLRRVSLKTGNAMLCVSATFADDDSSGERGITLNLATTRPRFHKDSPLASSP